MLTSKKLMELAAISRATLNNYIALGLLPKPEVRPADDGDDRAPRIGYFPENSLQLLQKIKELKRGGYSMAEIATMDRFVKNESATDRISAAQTPPAPAGITNAPSVAQDDNALRLTVENVDTPLYLVNNNFEIEWCNAQAAEILGPGVANAEDITERNVFCAFVNKGPLADAESWDEVIRFHLALAKNRLSRDELGKLRLHVGSDDMARIDTLYDQAEALGRLSLHNTEVNLAPRGEEPRWYELHATFFREGIVFGYVPRGGDNNGLVALLSRREVVIRELLKSRRPFLTPLAVLVADIQNSVKICAELPPEEYFELINDVWSAMEPLFRKYYATHGKHVGDGMVYYFFPQPDCNYLTNALSCAFEMQEVMRDISRRWRTRKNWGNDLLLNTGVDEGQEWFGTYQTPTHLEFTVLGDTINHAGRLSDFARGGSVWASKKLLGSLNPDDRARISFGIRRRGDSGEEILVASTYARINNLLDLEDPQNHKFRDIATLTVTEITDMEFAES
jgi:class 3 adenylate cyclase/DNA-binding transcriptional MerR regulator